MKITKIRKNTDYSIMLTNRFDLVIYNTFDERYEYPIILDKELSIDVPVTHKNIENFLTNKVDFLHGHDVMDFLQLTNIDITPFLWLIMDDGQIDIFWNDKDLYIKEQDDYIVLNSKNIDMKILDRLYKTQNKDYIISMYTECTEELFQFIRRKISNSIMHNEFCKSEITTFKDMEMQLEKAMQSKECDFGKALFCYEKMIRLREKYVKDNMFHLLSQQEIDEMSFIVQQIRAILNSSKFCEFHIERM